MKKTSQLAVRLPRNVLIGLVKAYRMLLSPWLGSACRFTPTCSVYALEALDRHGAFVGSGLTIYRLVRCQPWCKAGHDPVPTSTLFSHLVRPATPENSSLSREKSNP